MEQKTKMKRKTILKGYSLVELILTLLIIGVIAAIAIPSISSFVTESKIKATKREMMEIVRGMIGDPESGFYGYTDNLGDLPDELPGGPGLGTLSGAYNHVAEITRVFRHRHSRVGRPYHPWHETR